MDIQSKEIQKIEGYFGEEENSVDHKFFEGEAFINRFNLRESYVIFNTPVPKPERGNTICFVTRDEYRIYLRFPSSYMTGNYFEVKFRINKIVIPKSNEKYVRTGSFKRLVYLPEEIELFGFSVEKCERQYYEDRRKKRENYFEWSYEGSITEREIEKVLMALSFLTCCSLFKSEHSNGNTLTLVDLKSDRHTLDYVGSGMMFFPISIKTIEELIGNIKWKHIYRFQLAYKSFCSTKNYKFKLYNGCSILDYLITLFTRNLSIKQLVNQLEKHGKSAKLYAILWHLKLDNSIKQYLQEIFPEVSFSEFGFDKKFEFYELRDSHIHRGHLFLSQSEVWKYQRCLVSVNELIRILIPHLEKLDEWGFTDKPVLKLLLKFFFPLKNYLYITIYD